jgi:hypothetical protein
VDNNKLVATCYGQPLLILLEQLVASLLPSSRGVGPPQVLWSALFWLQSALFLLEKILKNCLFQATCPVENFNICYLRKNVNIFGKNVINAENFLVRSENFWVFWKNGLSGKNFWPLKWYTVRKFFGDGGGGRQKKINRCPFFLKSALQSLAPPTFRSFLRPCRHQPCDKAITTCFRLVTTNGKKQCEHILISASQQHCYKIWNNFLYVPSLVDQYL